MRVRLPHGRGMGSSGAAIVSGIMAAKGLLEGIVEIDAQGLLQLATATAAGQAVTKPCRHPKLARTRKAGLSRHVFTHLLVARSRSRHGRAVWDDEQASLCG